MIGITGATSGKGKLGEDSHLLDLAAKTRLEGQKDEFVPKPAHIFCWTEPAAQEALVTDSTSIPQKSHAVCH